MAARERPHNARRGWGTLGADGRERAARLLRENSERPDAPAGSPRRTRTDRRLEAIRSLMAGR